MTKRVEVSYSSEADEGERLTKVVGILSEGVYAYLKRRGLLKEGSGRPAGVAGLPHGAPATDVQAEAIQGEDS